MRSFKYIAVLVSNACFMAFVKYNTDDPIHRLLDEPFRGKWFLYSYVVHVLIYTLAAALLLAIWVALKKNLGWKPSIRHRILIAVGITLATSAHGYWKCYDEWARTSANPDRHAMADKMRTDGMALTADGFTYEEYTLLRRHSTWQDIPKSACNISLESNSIDRVESYPTVLTFYLPKGAMAQSLAEMMDVEPGINQEIEDMGDSIRVRYGR